MSSCIFCKIVEEESKSERIYETENTIAFLDIRPRAPGHTLVIPKKHVQTLTELDNELISELFQTVKKVEKLVNESLDNDAFTIGINDGEAAGQEIPHLHINVIPRYKNDNGKPIQSLVSNNPKKSLKNIATKIKE